MRLTTRSPLRPAVALTAILTVVWAVSACNAQEGTSAPAVSANPVVGQVCCVASRSSSSTVNGVATTHNGWDIAFINWLTPHDAVSGQMAALAATHSSTAAIKELAAVLDSSQQGRYVRLAAMAGAWHVPVPSTDPAAATGHDHGGTGSSEAADAETLTSLTGAAFDKALLTIMIAHHVAAQPVAQATVANGVNDQARQMAEDLLTTQAAEIAHMQTLVGSL